MFNIFRNKQNDSVKNMSKQVHQFNEQLRLFNEQLRKVRVLLYVDLRAHYSKEMDGELAGVLAAQAVNYLLADDNNQAYIDADNSLKSLIDKIKQQILIKAEEKMKSDSLARKTIVYTLRMLNVYQFANQGEAYPNSSQKQRIEEILIKYGSEFPQEANPTLYTRIVNDFLNSKKHFLKQSI
jgi:hypothetical protein